MPAFVVDLQGRLVDPWRHEAAVEDVTKLQSARQWSPSFVKEVNDAAVDICGSRSKAAWHQVM